MIDTEVEINYFTAIYFQELAFYCLENKIDFDYNNSLYEIKERIATILNWSDIFSLLSKNYLLEITEHLAKKNNVKIDFESIYNAYIVQLNQNNIIIQ